MTVEPPERDLLSNSVENSPALHDSGLHLIRRKQVFPHRPRPWSACHLRQSGRMSGLLCGIGFDTKEADPGCRITPASPRRAERTPLEVLGSTDSDKLRMVSPLPLDWLATSFTGCRSVIERRQSRLPLLSTIGRVFRRRTFRVCDDCGNFIPLEVFRYHDRSESKTRK